MPKVDLTIGEMSLTVDTAELLTTDSFQRIKALCDFSAHIGKARAQLDRCEAMQIQWRAEAVCRIADAHPKWPEWRVKAAVDSEPIGLTFKESVVKAREVFTVLWWVCESLRVSSGLQQRIGLDQPLVD